jgi:hypothetical protein
MTLNRIDGWTVVSLSLNQGKGPLTLAQLKSLVEDGTLEWTDLAFHPSTRKWERLFEVVELGTMLPKSPSPDFLRGLEPAGAVIHAILESAPSPTAAATPEVRPASLSNGAIHAQTSVGRTWGDALTAAAAAHRSLRGKAAYYVLIEGREIGPVDVSDLERAFKLARRLPGSAYAWRDGMRRWRLFAAIPELSRFVQGSEQARTARVLQEPELVIERVHRRKSERKPMIAHVNRIGRTTGRQMIGVCGDVSTDGFQLIQEIGAREFSSGGIHRLEICPMKLMNVPRLTLEATVRWNDRASGCVGFEFKALDQTSRDMLHEYLFGRAKKIA